MSSFFFSSRRRHTRSLRDWSSDVCSSDLTWLLGTFTVSGGAVTGGTITSMLHSNSNGAITYESITGAATDAVAFLNAPNGAAKFAMVRSEERRVGKECRSRWGWCAVTIDL